LLDPGKADLIVQKLGFVAWIGTIELISGASVTLRPELKESTDGPPPPQPTGSEAQRPTETVTRRSVAPQVLYKVDPGYTEQARHAGLEGKVVLQFIVDTTGQAREIHVLRGLGMGLDEKAVEAVNAWKFRPGTRGGKAVAVQGTVQVDFRLRDQ
jgi:TonB family protein